MNLNQSEVETKKASFFSQGPWANPLSRFLASLKLAILIFVALIVVMAAGTFIESYYGADAAKILIYQAPWFWLIFLLLGLNLAFAAFDRWPWKKKHMGFVVTHAGIILILLGAFWTAKTMIDGQIAVS